MSFGEARAVPSASRPACSAKPLAAAPKLWVGPREVEEPAHLHGLAVPAPARRAVVAAAAGEEQKDDGRDQARAKVLHLSPQG